MKTLFTLPEANKARQVGPRPVTAITMINPDQNTAPRRSRGGGAPSLMECESSAAPTVNTSPSDATVWTCVLSLPVCLCVCGRPLTLMASFHCGLPVSSEHVPVVSSDL